MSVCLPQKMSFSPVFQFTIPICTTSVIIKSIRLCFHAFFLLSCAKESDSFHVNLACLELRNDNRQPSIQHLSLHSKLFTVSGIYVNANVIFESSQIKLKPVCLAKSGNFATGCFFNVEG